MEPAVTPQGAGYEPAGFGHRCDARHGITDRKAVAPGRLSGASLGAERGQSKESTLLVGRGCDGRHHKKGYLAWRRSAEEEIRRSGLDYTIVRAGFLTNGPGGPTSDRGEPAWIPARAEVPNQPDRRSRDLRSSTEASPDATHYVRAGLGQGWRDRNEWNALFSKLVPDS